MDGYTGSRDGTSLYIFISKYFLCAFVYVGVVSD